MVILSAVIASVVSEVGLGSEPAFKVPDYDFRSPSGNTLSYISANVLLLLLANCMYNLTQLCCIRCYSNSNPP